MVHNSYQGSGPGSEKSPVSVFTFSDLVAFHTVLVEQCQPLQLSSLQNQKHHCYQKMVYALQEHDYESPEEVQMAFILAKREVRTYLMSKQMKIPSMFFKK